MKEKRSLNINKIYPDHLGRQFKKVFNQTKKKDVGWFHPLKKKKRKNKVILTDTIRDVLKCFIPEKKYGPLLVNKGLRSLGYKTAYNAEADYLYEKLGLWFEFDGNHHYMEPFKYLSDERKYDSLKSIELKGKPIKINIIRIPYYYGFTRDVAKYIFKTLIKYFQKGNTKLPIDGFYTDEKYLKAISKIHKNMFTGKPATLDIEVPACGIHESVFGPAGYCLQGIDKLLADFDLKGDLEPPKSIEHQYMWCLKQWIDDINNGNNDDRSWLILPHWHKRFMERYNDNINNRKEEYLQHVFARDYDSIIRTKK
ncbi:hypothetical protein OAI70_00295 [Candidatus Pelagibacter sp.]|nr:hypothetical protein [Candidatus Pelagibacter sp.]